MYTSCRVSGACRKIGRADFLCLSVCLSLCPTGWCNMLSAGPSAGAKGYMFFSVAMDLTEEGEGLQ